MKCSSCKNYKCSACSICLFVSLALAAAVAVLAVMWCRSTGKHVSIFGIVISQGDVKQSTGKPLVVSEAKHKKVIATIDDFKNMLLILERGEPGMQFISALPETEQKKIYRGIVNDYLINNYLIKEYIKDMGIDKTEDFKKEYEQFGSIMAGTFYSGIFQRKVNESIIINDDEAKTYYETARFEVPEFMNAPFALQVPGVEARAVRIDEGKQASDYATRLKQNKDVMNLGRVHRSIRGMSMRIVDALSAMKDGETRAVELENGASFALYRVAEHAGKWANYDEVADQVKRIMRVKTVEKRCQDILSELRTKQAIVVDEVLIDNIVQEKKAQPNLVEELAMETLAEEAEADEKAAE